MKFTAQSASTWAASTQAASTLFRRALYKLARPALVAAALIVTGPIVTGWSGTVSAAEPGLDIELNKAEDGDGTCVASLVVRNDMGQTLDRFSMDLYVFDRDGVIARQVLLDLAPLKGIQGGAKTTVARFNLIARPCAEVSRVLVNDIPSCRGAGSGETLDCLTALTVSSRGKIEMVK